ncbi:MAG: shikimate dehydrogenase [Devosia sp.]|nr:shikimate dehydrogenase [Devosia sp.]
MARRHADRGAGAVGRSVLVGLIGRGIGRSRSPQMHRLEGERLGMAYSYELIDFDQLGLTDEALGDVVAAADEQGVAGLNVTHPFKQAVVPHLSALAPEAAAIGAVNTVAFEGTRWVGHNTDAWGFAESLRRGLPDANLDHVIQFGAGGGGAAVAYALLERGAHDLSICDSDNSRAATLVHRLNERFGRSAASVADPLAALNTASGAINATPIGMDKYPGVAFDPEELAAHQWVADIVYFPAETELLRRSRARGCRVLPGTGMAIYQAVKAFELFTGIAPDRDAMRRHFEAAA